MRSANDPFVNPREPYDEMRMRSQYLRAEHLRELLDSLPRPYRAVIEALSFEGCSHAEVAERFQISRKSVPALLEAAQKEARERRRLKQLGWEVRPDPVVTDYVRRARIAFDGCRPAILLHEALVLPEVELRARIPRVKGAIRCLRFLDRCEELTPQAALLQEYCECRLVRRRSPLSQRETSLREGVLSHERQGPKGPQPRGA